MTAPPSDHTPPGDDRLLVPADEAARRLGISRRLLWSLTNTKQVPHVRVNRRVLYPVDGLAAWVKARTEGSSS